MVLFLFFLVPAAVALLILRFNREGESIILPTVPFFWGMLLFFPSLFIQSIITGLFDPSYTAVGLYFQTLLREHFLFTGSAVGWAVLLRYSLFQPVKQSSPYRMLAFFGGYYTILNVSAYLHHITHLDYYVLFLSPALSLATAVAASFLVVHCAGAYGWGKYASLAALVGLPFVTNIVTVSYLRNLPFLSIAGTVLMLGVSFALFYILKERIY